MSVTTQTILECRGVGNNWRPAKPEYPAAILRNDEGDAVVTEWDDEVVRYVLKSGEVDVTSMVDPRNPNVSVVAQMAIDMVAPATKDSLLFVVEPAN